MYKKLTLIILSLLIINSIQAQKKESKVKVKPNKVKEKGRMVVGLHAGLSLTGVAYEAFESDTVTLKYLTSVKPAIQGTFDYFYTNKITFGFFASLQPFRVDISTWQYDSLNPKRIEDLQAKMKRIYIGGKVLYHFKNTEKVDIYSGIRAGVLFWNNKLPTTDPSFIASFKKEFPQLNRPSITIIPIGFRIKFTPQIAANIELNASAPHIISFGACYTIK